MDAVSQSLSIIVTSTHDDASRRRHLGMQADKMAPIKRQYGSPRRGRTRSDRGVCYALACLPCLVRRENVMTELPQALDDGITAILVRVQSGHRLEAVLKPLLVVSVVDRAHRVMHPNAACQRFLSLERAV
jgi:hypothetical protein